MNKLQAFLEQTPVLLADGAMGTMLFSAGLDPGDSPQLWNLTHPDRVQSVHRAYLEAGSRLLLTNTFGGNRFRLARHDLTSRAAQLNRAGSSLLREVADQNGDPVLVAGDIGPTGELFAPLGKLSHQDAAEAFCEQAGALLDGGADLIWIETMSALPEVLAAVEGVRKASAEAPVIVTLTFEKHGKTMMGVSPEQAVQVLLPLGIAALGGNCGTGPEELLEVIAVLHRTAPALPLVFKPNAGVPELIGGVTRYNATPESMAECSLQAARRGARIIGGCCGSTPAHLRAMTQELRAAQL
jgi:methionine synthase I (cobalamin-dependent)